MFKKRIKKGLIVKEEFKKKQFRYKRISITNLIPHPLHIQGPSLLSQLQHVSASHCLIDLLKKIRAY